MTDDIPDPAARRAFLDARRHSSRERYDATISAGYDEAWGVISASHARSLERLLALTRPHGMLLDAACGTGKYWPTILATGRTVVGTDQSAGMLEAARRKHPQVPSGCLALQELAFEAAFDAVICVDALENVGPEDWPMVTRRLAAAARPAAPMYLTVELADPTELQRTAREARAQGHPVLAGEDFDGIGYHYYPERDPVLEWVTAAGLALVEESEGDGYWHLLLRKGSGPR